MDSNTTVDVAAEIVQLKDRMTWLEDALSHDYSLIWSNITAVNKNINEVKTTVARLQGAQRFEDIVSKAVETSSKPKVKIHVSRSALFVVGGIFIGITMAQSAAERKKAQEAVNERG